MPYGSCCSEQRPSLRILCFFLCLAGLALALPLTAPARAADYSLSGTNGADALDGGADGRSVKEVKAGDFAVDGAVSLKGGDGGWGDADGTKGGKGGKAELSVGGDFSSQGDVSLTGGNGGNGGIVLNSPGGAGGGVTLSVGGDFSNQGNVSLIGGRGGDSNDILGGAGGNAVLRAASVTVGGTLSLTSGAEGFDMHIPDGGAGGAARLEAGSLYAPAIALTKEDGDLRFSVGTLRVKQGTTLAVTNTSAADIAIKTLAFDLTGARSGATMLDISGNGRVDILSSGMRMGLAGGGS